MQVQDSAPALLMAEHCDVAEDASKIVFLNEEKVFPMDASSDMWYFNTGASNHMTGAKEMFTSLDDSVKGTVKFRDGTMVEICGKAAVMFRCQNKEHRVLSEVYFIPQLHGNIVNLGQLDESECKVVIEHGELSIYDC